MKKLYCVISHTHWDREWYLSLENFRVKLVDLLDNLLEILGKDENYRFHLDAQTIVLEDYLLVRRSKKGLLKKYISEGRLLVGPWYVQNDLFLTSGEATVRNLMIGTRIAEEYGKSMRIGYVPDQFGIISQLPQILNKFSIHESIFGRGYMFGEKKSSEFYWKSEDGSCVLVSFLSHWYNNAQRFSPNIENSLEMLRFIDNNISKVATTGNYLLMNGVDHLEAQEDVLEIINELNKRLPEGERIIQDTLPEYMARLRTSVGELAVETGEMRYGPADNMLTGTLSTRVYLKKYNALLQNRLEKQLEPLYAYLHVSGVKEYPKDYFMYLWKLLLENHAHDSICGCSLDSVHEQMMDRFKRVDEASSSLLLRGMELAMNYINREGLSEHESLLTVFNPSQLEIGHSIEAVLQFPASEEVGAFVIMDGDGRIVPFEILGKQVREKAIHSAINLPGTVTVDEYVIQLQADVPGLSLATFIVSPVEGEFKNESAYSTVHELENEYLKVVLNGNGTVDVLHKETGQLFQQALWLEDCGDTGDAYVYGSTALESTITSLEAEAKVELLANNKLKQAYKFSYVLDLPERFDFESNQRSVALVPCVVEVELSLSKRQKYLDVAITIDNQARDHRIRVIVPTGLQSSMSFAGSPFDIVQRDRATIGFSGIKEKQKPQTEFVAVHDEGQGLAVFNQGLYEYEHLDNGDLAITLLRGNQFISKDPAEHWRAEGNQCIGLHRADMALYPFAGTHLEGSVAGVAQQFAVGPVVHFQPVDVRKFTGGSTFVQGIEQPELFYQSNKYTHIILPRDVTILKSCNPRIVFTALKKHEDGDMLVVRGYNTSSRTEVFSLKAFAEIQEASLMNLGEEITVELAVDNGKLEELYIKPKEIITIGIRIR
ncbi:alpha-mannosidase [Pseudogracilibacillus auburnensis]|uniref:alpha-mannosidase n=1 Tax=Pseudogracilibacillus auburnensis TaxID=1494959 RepID=UPI001A97398F|nr:glycoside hydrolase family 38 C-terminal domain-containing protein [Pseudogracilibacillus auburnensis]MBO1004767.1 hypothetical protein [Pseudogracilibacillus auburnensis]